MLLGVLLWLVVPAANVMCFRFWSLLLCVLLAIADPFSMFLSRSQHGVSRGNEYLGRQSTFLPEFRNRPAVHTVTCYTVMLAVISVLGLVMCITSFVNAGHSWPAYVADEVLTAVVALLVGVASAVMEIAVLYESAQMTVIVPVLKDAENKEVETDASAVPSAAAGSTVTVIRVMRHCCHCGIQLVLIALMVLSTWRGTKQAEILKSHF